MQKLFITLSQKQIGDLYHYTKKDALLAILRSGKIGLSTGRARGSELEHQGNKNFFASFTRSRFGGYHYDEGGKVSHYGDTSIMVTLDGTKLSNTYKIIPVDYWGHRGNLGKDFDRTKEVEERLISNKSEIDILKFIKKIDFIQSANAMVQETYGFDRGTWKKVENERLEQKLGSIILQLKKNKIPYEFYNSMDDWARKRGAYSYIGPKKVHTDKSVRSQHYGYEQIKSLLECFSDKPYERLSEDAQAICRNASTYPRDIAGIFNEYENNRKPGSDQVKRAIALKIANAMQRLNINSQSDAGKFIAAKYEVYRDAERKKENNARSNILAPLFVEALRQPIGNWSQDKVYNSPYSSFKNMDSRYGYLGDDVERTVKNILESEGREIDKLKQVLEKLGLKDSSEIVSHIYYENVRPR